MPHTNNSSTNTRGNTMYIPDPHRMAHAIASQSLKSVREEPNTPIGEWYVGRTCAVALMFNDPEIQAAKNEVRFLTGAYRMRHYGAGA
jgi:hypothetical protein